MNEEQSKQHLNLIFAWISNLQSLPEEVFPANYLTTQLTN